MKRRAVTIVATAALAIGAYFVLALVSGGRFVLGTLDSVVPDVVRVSGLSPWLVKSVAIVVTIPLLLGGGEVHEDLVRLQPVASQSPRQAPTNPVPSYL